MNNTPLNSEQVFQLYYSQMIDSPSKPTKQFLHSAQVDQNFIHKMQYAMNTRSRVTRQINSFQLDRYQDKKKYGNKKQPYTPPQTFQIQQHELISFEIFKTCFQDLINNEKQKVQQFINNLDFLYNIYQSAHNQGGILYISSIGNFPQLITQFLKQSSPTAISQQFSVSQIQKIRQLLYTIQYLTSKPNKQKKIYQLGLVTFIKKQQLKTHIQDLEYCIKYFIEDLTLFQQGTTVININKCIFNLDYVCQYYKKQYIDIRIQNPLDYGFKPLKLKNKQYSMTLGDYRYYQLNYKNCQEMKIFKHSDQLGKGQIFYGVNFQHSDEMINNEIKKCVKGTFFDFHGDFDLMSYLDTDVPGCSLPQMYFKINGCWTGGHQQNINMSALNINHGPDASQWYTLDLKYIEQLRKQLNQQYGTDLYLSEGLWYEKIQWFISHGYPVKRFLQRKDDIVVTGPGTLHWVRSLGMAMHTSWNIMPKTYQQFIAAFERHKLNKQIKFHKSDTIPLKSLIVKYLNHQRAQMSQNILSLCVHQLSQWHQYEQQLLGKQFMDRIAQKSYFYLKDLESFCCLCRQEILVYFVAAPVQFGKGISCLECYLEVNKNNNNIGELYYKYQHGEIEKLIEYCRNTSKYGNQVCEIQSLCKGTHVGKIQGGCKLSPKQKTNIMIGNAQHEKTGCIKQVYYEDKEIMEIHEYLDVVFKRNKGIIKDVVNFVQEKDRGKGTYMKQNKNGMIAEELSEGEIGPDQTILLAKQPKNRQCQTCVPYPQIKQANSDSNHKKKKKHKHKKKKQKQHSPQFSSDSFEKQRSQEKRQNTDNYQQYHGDRQRDNDNYGNDNMQRNRKNNYRNNETGERQFRDRNSNNNYRDNNRNNYTRDNYQNNDFYQGNRDNHGSFNDDNNYRNNNDGNNRGRNQDEEGNRNNWRSRDNNYNRFERNDQYQGGNRNYQGDGDTNDRFRGRRPFNNYDRNNQNEGGDRGGFRGRGRGRGRGGFNRDNNFTHNDNQGGNNNKQGNFNFNRQSNINNNDNPMERNNSLNLDNTQTISKTIDPEQY